MTNTNHTTLAWRPIAEQMINELRLHHLGRARVLAETDAKTSTQVTTSHEDSELNLLWSKFQGEVADPQVEAGAPVAPIPTREVLAAIRVAKAFGTSEVIRAGQDPAAITVLRDIGVDDLDAVNKILRLCWPETEWMIIAPSIHDGGVSRDGTAKFYKSISTCLDTSTPILVLLTDGLRLPGHIEAADPTTYALPCIDADIIIERLRAGQLGNLLSDEAGFRDALPSDSALARLTTSHAVVALRAPDRSGVIRALRSMTGQDAESGPRLEDLTGHSPALLAARRLVDDLLGWKHGAVRWSELSRSLLLYGPPGTGKTWLARAMGNSAGLNVVTGTFGEWQAAGHLGDMLREMRKTFAQARRLAPCVLIIDEIDAVGSRTDGDRHASNYRANVINAFLAEMDMISREEGVIVIGTCNHIDRIDTAVIRAGRFDQRLEVPLPDAEALLGLLRQQLREDIADIDLRQIAQRAVGRSPAEIDAAIRAARSDARHQRRLLSAAMLRDHLKLDQAGDHPGLLRRVAVHEAGHAVIGAALGLGGIERMMITEGGGEIHRSGMLSESLLTDIEDEICYDLGGRAAERLVTGIASAGAGGPEQSDLAKATTRALHLEAVYGLGLEGPVWHHNPGAMMMQDSLLRARVRQRIERQERRAGEILAQHRPTLAALARELMQKRSLNAAEISAHLRAITHPDEASADDTVAQIDAMLEAMVPDI